MNISDSSSDSSNSSIDDNGNLQPLKDSIVDTIDNDYLKLALDQKILKEVYQTYTKLDKSWIRHYDVKDDTDKLHHSQCLIYHTKGARGKL